MENPAQNPKGGLDWMAVSAEMLEGLKDDGNYLKAARLIKIRFTGVHKVLRNDFEDLLLEPDKQISDKDWGEEHTGLVQECTQLIADLKDDRIREHIEPSDLRRIDDSITEFEAWMNQK